MNIPILIIVLLGATCFGFLLHASLTQEPVINQMQVNYKELYEETNAKLSYIQSELLYCIYVQSDKQTQVHLIETIDQNYLEVTE